ncbi:MAG TPA: peroxiredoxin [Myxococcota bacterium]|nr:peroxiredoxin [Myxococcota bacterium]HNH45969.1 peroxiredoxin [Myxococcota bacterium]
MSTIPRIGDTAPDFTAVTTHGTVNFSEWQQGKWVVLFSHPADFTPVCTTEISELARRNAEFEARGVKLIGLSIDSIHSHLAWMESVEKISGITVPFPMIADLDTKVAQAYGMIHPGASSTVTVRAVFVIDPSRVVRALIYYPLTNGRNIDEIVRLVDSLQASSAHGIATPANWRPGDRVIVPATTTMEARKARLADGSVENVAPYLAYKQL